MADAPAKPWREQVLDILEAEMNRYGRFIVFTVDRDDVRERIENKDGTPLPDAIADEIAKNAALDLASNNMDSVPLGDAIDAAWEVSNA